MITADDLKIQVYEYLDELRESAVTNMLGATPYIMRKFGLGYEKSKQLLLEWMESFGKREESDADAGSSQIEV